MKNLRLISPDNNKLTYFGRWEVTEGAAFANWNNPYIVFSFKGEVLKAAFGNGADIEVDIDGKVSGYTNINREITVAENLDDRIHNVKLTVTNADSKTSFDGIWVNEDAEIIKYNREKKYIQFIGDSITTSKKSYSYTIPREYNFDYSIISMNGISLMDNSGWYFAAENCVWSKLLKREESVGIESSYFCLKSPRDAYCVKDDKLIYDNPDYDIEGEISPDIVVIGIGTNDKYYVNENIEGLTENDFKNAYSRFVKKLVKVYPRAEIYILRQFNNTADDFEKINSATEKMCKTLDLPQIHYIDTSDWVVEISNDNVHPSDKGFECLRDLVYNAITLQE